jgi:hypothetical protein
MNVIIVGAKNDEVCDTIDSWNNPKQAKHSDLVLMKEMFECDIICYDLGYSYDKELDGIQYVNQIFYLDGMALNSQKLNVIVEFNNMLDENYINHGEDNVQHHNLKKLRETEKKVAILACGCSWSKGFPSECISYLYYGSLTTPCDAYNVDNLLYVISNTQCIRSLAEKDKEIMYPYQLGLYQTMGTFMWRGYEGDQYKSENVLRELFGLIGVDCVKEGYDDLICFVKGSKHWNNLPWNVRKELSEFVYGM